MKKTLRSVIALALAFMLTFVMGTAMAAFPEKEVTIVVPFKAGGNVDLCCRIIADEMTRILGKQVVVEDREGGGAIIGQTYALGQPADGYTMLALTSSFVTNILSGDTDFGIEDAAAIGQFCFDPEIVVASADSGITNMDEFMAAAKAESLTNSTPGFSTSHHIASLIMTEQFGLTPFSYMHTDGSADQVVQLAGGHAQVGLTTYGGAATLIQEGKIIPLAVCNSERHQALPDVPTMAECGYDFVYGAYRGFAVPAGTPEDVIGILSDALKQAMESEAVIKAFNDSGFPIMYMNAADYQAFLATDYANMEAIYYLLDEE
ncbi:MAG: tripartite tricarboxylate transporter substrate binding protein [Clostridia bacterium]|nr:tripartite tricarboxylate transporter substrate binding protein [Clostridia bacterium]